MMKRKFAKRLLSLVLSVMTLLAAMPTFGGFSMVYAADVSGADVTSVPAVREVTTASGTFTLSTSARFYIVAESDPTGSDAGVYVQTVSSEFAAKGIPSSSVLPIMYGAAENAQKGDIVIIPDSSEVTKEQGYLLTITSENITLKAKDAAGVLNGLHTVLQSMVSGGTTLNCCTVNDYPDVAERSVYLDCGRVYFKPETIKALIRALSWNKMNVLYLDFSNNNATRFFLDEMNVTAGGTIYYITGAQPDDGYLTQSDMDGILAEAEKYGVEIIPTFNSPGHMGGLYSLNNSLFDKGTATDYDSSCGKITLLIEDEAAYEFGIEVTSLYIDYFASKGCKYFNIAADEATLGNVKYDSDNATFVQYVNELNECVKDAGMSTRMFNDGFESTTCGIDTDITVLYWAPEGTAEAFMDAGYNLVNLSYGAGLYYAYLGSVSGWWVWNQDVSLIYSNWNPGIACRNTGDAYASTYVATETISDYKTNSKFTGSCFAIWTDYAFNSGLNGTTLFAQNNYNMMQKIYTVAERSWSTVCTSDYSTWSASLKAAPAGLTLSGSVDTTTLPAASSITKQAAQVTVQVEGDDTVIVTGPDLTGLTYTVYDASSLNVPNVVDNKIVAYDVTPTDANGEYTGSATVKIKVPAGWNTDTLSAFVVNSDNTIKVIKGNYTDGYYVFQAPHFSVTGINETDTTVEDYYTSGVTETTTAGTTEWQLVTGGITALKSGKEYLIVSDSSGTVYALTKTAGRQELTVSNSVIAHSAVTGNNIIWTFESGTYDADEKTFTCYLKDESGTYLYPMNTSGDDRIYYEKTNSVGVTIEENNNGFSIRHNGATAYLRYRSSRNSWTTDNSSRTVYLFQKVDTTTTAYTVDVAPLTNLINLVKESVGAESTYTTTSWSAYKSALTAAENAVATTTYATEAEANAQVTALNTAAENLYDAWQALELWETNHVQITVVQEFYNTDGTSERTTSTTMWVAKGDAVVVNPPVVSGYDVDKSYVTINTNTTTSVTFKYTKKAFYIENSITLPISIIDYRSDGLLFDYDYNTYSYGYSLVHSNTYPAHGSYSSGTTYGTQIPGDDLGTSIADTYLEIRNRFSDDITGRWGTAPLNGGWVRTGMVEATLGSNGLPVYTDATVQAVGYLLSLELYNDGVLNDTFNYNDTLVNTFLADDAERSVVGTSYDAMSTAFSVSQSYSNIQNAYDLAWYLLNTLYVADGNTVTDNGHTVPIYGMGVDTYQGIVLKKDSDGNYVYDSAYATTYDKENGYIYNTDTPGSIITDKASYVNRFWPIDSEGYDSSDLYGATTSKQAGTASQNGNFALVGSAQFVYKSDDYFYFSGDDDVYLFINGKLALDLGGAHGVCYNEINLSELDAEYYGLVEGEVATFTFFYMERCSDNSNFSMRTNIQLANVDMEVDKKSYDSKGAEIPSGSVVNEDDTFIYDLIVRNVGNTTITGITLTDSDSVCNTISIGKNASSDLNWTPTDGSGSNYTIDVGLTSGYVLYKTDLAGNEVADSRLSFTTLEDLSDAVAAVELLSGEVLHVRFLNGSISIANEDTPTAVDYVNTVKVTADGGYNGTAQHMTYTYAPGNGKLNFVVDYGLPLVLNADNLALPDEAKSVTISSANVNNFGTLALSGSLENGNLALTYTQNAIMTGAETITLSVVYEFGTGTSAYTCTYDKVISVIPASTVYYEDTFVTFSGAWATDGTSSAANQLTEVLGQSGIYGNDSAYNNSNLYSLGSAHKVTVGGSDYATATFAFKGTGFDIIALTSNTSGTILIDVKDSTGTSTFYMVDTYYGYKYENGEWVVDTASSDTLYQVPVMKVTGLAYGEYTVKVTAAYNKVFDHTGKGSYDLYFDAVRIYEPLGSDGNAMYSQDGEGWPTFTELRDMIIGANDFNAATDAVDGIVFIDGNAANTSIADYTNYGPNNELYLAPGQAIAFVMTDAVNVADIQVGMKSADGSTISYAVRVDGTSSTGALSTSTDMYYSIGANAAGKLVTITNTGDSGILSITTLKTTYTTAPTTGLSLRMTQSNALAAVNSVTLALAAPAVPETPETDEPETDNSEIGSEDNISETETPDDETTTPDQTPEDDQDEETSGDANTSSGNKGFFAELGNFFKKLFQNLFGKLFG